METKREFDGRSDVYGMSVLPDIGKRCEGREESNAVSARRRRFLREGLRILGIGTAYFFWVCLTGVGIPCPFRLLTGYLCPGCDHALFVALLQFHFADAYLPTRFCLS